MTDLESKLIEINELLQRRIERLELRVLLCERALGIDAETRRAMAAEEMAAAPCSEQPGRIYLPIGGTPE